MLGSGPVGYLQKRGGVEFGITNSASCREEYLNPGPSNYKFSLITTRPGGRVYSSRFWVGVTFHPGFQNQTPLGGIYPYRYYEGVTPTSPRATKPHLPHPQKNTTFIPDK